MFIRSSIGYVMYTDFLTVCICCLRLVKLFVSVVHVYCEWTACMARSWSQCILVKGKTSPILVTERLARSWSRRILVKGKTSPVLVTKRLAQSWSQCILTEIYFNSANILSSQLFVALSICVQNDDIFLLFITHFCQIWQLSFYIDSDIFIVLLTTINITSRFPCCTVKTGA